ncbi:Clp protease N-terminal domain-containing protein [Paractinoplanes maris]|uniref:Clp protease N-terminal domain-containing protein n=1 Tax=Paractinoplanes maris TaxID=1734446 RepID=UPI0020212E3F|nr:Clp protease N-terminal domain-containing protein [Actinoplanes maris]
MESSLGARAVRVLEQAYVTAARRNGETVTTLDVLAWVAAHDNRIFPGATWTDLKYLATKPTGIRDAPEPAPGPFHADVPAILREVEWRAHRLPRMSLPASPDWTPAVRFVLTGALNSARVPFVGLPNLALEMLRLPDCSGTKALFPYEYARAAAVERLATDPALRYPDKPHPTVDDVRVMVTTGRRPLLDRLFLRMSRFARVSPLLTETTLEARRQAVRLGHGVISPEHLLLALLTLDDVLAAAGIAIPPGHNQGAALLRAHGLAAADLTYGISLRPAPAEPPAEDLTAQLDRLRPGDPFDATASVQAQAMEISLTRHHPDTGTSHLLLALLDTSAAGLVTDPDALRSQATRDLDAVPAAWP